MKRKPFDPVEDSVVPKSVSRLGLIIKITLAVGLILSLGWLSLRACLQDGTSKMKKYIWTEAAIEQKKNGKLTVNQLAEFNDPDLSRLFYIGRIYHTEEIGQLQFMLRYNVLSREYEKYSSDGTFAFELVTEANKEVSARYGDYCYITDKALMYRYYRIAFENVELAGVDGAQVIIYYDLDGERTEIGRCIVYDKDGASEKMNPGKAKKPSAGLIYVSSDTEK